MSFSNKNNFIYYFVQNIFVGIVPLISLAIFTRVFSPEEYGVYALILIFGNFFSSITTFGLSVSYEKLFFELEESKKIILLHLIILFCFLLFILFFFPIFFFGNIIINYFEVSNVTNHLLYTSYVSSTLISYTNFFLLKYRNEKSAKKYTLLSLFLIFSQLLVSVLLIIYFGYRIEGFLYSSILVNLIVLLIYLKEISFYKILKRLDILKNAIIIAFPLMPKILLGFLNSSYDKVLLGFLKDQGSLGIYDISYKISRQCFNFSVILGNTYLPDFYSKLINSNKNYKKEIPDFLTKYFILNILFCICISFFSFELVSLILAKEFYFAINITSILCVFFSCYFFQSIPILVHLGKTMTISILTVLFFIISILIVFPGTYYFGIYGMAISLAISNIINLIIYIYVCQKNLKLNWNFKLISMIYLYFFSTTFLIIILREIEFFYPLRLIIKLILIYGFVYFINYKKIVNVKFYWNELMKNFLKYK